MSPAIQTSRAGVHRAGHAKIHSLEPSTEEDAWWFVHHDTDGNSLVMRSRGKAPWNERVTGTDDL
jgi:hypothetical protein